MSVLEKIKKPSDIKKLTLTELQSLSTEIRKLIVETVSRTGGHIASNLGAVELTIALLYTYNPENDRIIWDVGHQTYTYKILTERLSSFPTLRQAGGLSGFPRRSESKYDHFGTGHASTSISAALGFAAARDLSGGENHVIAVIGDGSLTGGMAYEALNHAGSMKTPITIVLNDNSMSINPNVGAMSSYLARIRMEPFYNQLKKDTKELLGAIPMFGEAVSNFIGRFKSSIKYMLMPGMIFEELGFKYVGPVDGHDIEMLIKTFEQVRKIKAPVLVHVSTIKGKGYAPAEENPGRFHSALPFEMETGKPAEKKAGCTFTDVFGKALCEEARSRKELVAITAAMMDGTGLKEFASEFPERFYDVGICEEHAVTFAAGLAAAGKKPVVAIYSTFLQRAYDQIVHDVCLQNLPVSFVLDRSGIVGEDGPTHHGLFDISYLRHIPNAVVMAPRDEETLRDMLHTALECGRPAFIRYPKGPVNRMMNERPPRVIETGRGIILREGTDIALIGLGPMVNILLDASEELLKNGVRAMVIDARFAKPLDRDLIFKALSTCGTGLSLEENVIAGGFGSAIAEELVQAGLDVRFYPAGIPDIFVEHGSTEELREALGLSKKHVLELARSLLKEKLRSGRTAKLGEKGIAEQ